MLVGLRKSWYHTVREDAAAYATAKGKPPLFSHERLEVYRLSLDLVKWSVDTHQLQTLPARRFRRLDEILTAIPLNIAEGNGRYSRYHQRSFVEMANRRAFQASAQVDLLVAGSHLGRKEGEEAKRVIASIGRMTHALEWHLGNRDEVLDEVLDEVSTIQEKP